MKTDLSTHFASLFPFFTFFFEFFHIFRATLNKFGNTTFLSNLFVDNDLIVEWQSFANEVAILIANIPKY